MPKAAAIFKSSASATLSVGIIGMVSPKSWTPPKLGSRRVGSLLVAPPSISSLFNTANFLRVGGHRCKQ